MPDITEENRKLYIYIGKLHRALCNAMDSVENIYYNGENCPYCGDDYNLEHDEFLYNCENLACEGKEAQKLLNEVNQTCGEKILAVGQGTLNIMPRESFNK